MVTRKANTTSKPPKLSQSTSQLQIPAHTINDFVRFILNMMGAKRSIKRTDIVKAVMAENGRNFNEVNRRANEILKDVYGLTLVEVPECSDRQFIVLNTLENPKFPTKSPKEKAQYAVLFIVLAHIFMSGGVSDQEKIFSLLRKMKILSDTPHERFGDVRYLVCVDFPQKLYLAKTRSTLSQPKLSQLCINDDNVDYAWGFRAEREISKESCLIFVSKVYGRSAKTFPALYKICMEAKSQKEETVQLESDEH